MADDNEINVAIRAQTDQLASDMNANVTVVEDGTRQMRKASDVLTQGVNAQGDAYDKLSAKIKAAFGGMKASEGLAAFKQMEETEAAAAAEADKLADNVEKVADSSKHVTQSFYQTSLVGRELFGGQIPRALERVIANSEVLSGVVQKIFPVAAGIAIAGMLIKIGEEAYNVAKQYIDWGVNLDVIPAKLTPIQREVETLTKKTHDLAIEQMIYEGHLTKAQADALKANEGVETEVQARFALNKLLEQQGELMAGIKKRQDDEAATQHAQDTGKFSVPGGKDKTERTTTDEEIGDIAALEQAISVARARVAELHQEVQTGSAKTAKQMSDDNAKEIAQELKDRAAQVAQLHKDFQSMMTDHANAKRQEADFDERTAALERKTQQGLTEFYAHEEDRRQLRQAQANDAAIQGEEKSQLAQLEVVFSKDQQEMILAGASKAKLLQLEQQHEQAKTLIIQQALTARRALYMQYLAQHPENPQAMAQLNALNKEIEAETLRHETALTQIKKAQVTEQVAEFKKMYATISADATNNAKQLIFGQETFGQAAKNMAEGVASTYIDKFAKIASDWIENQIMMKVFGIASTQEMAVGAIAAQAAQAYAAAWASTSAIPVIGPGLAPAAAAAAYTGAISAEGFAFEKGGLVPYDTMAMVHKNEMVLPEHLSRGMQEMIGSGGGSSRTEVHIHAMDAKSFIDRIDDVSGQLAQRMKRKAKLGRF